MKEQEEGLTSVEALGIAIRAETDMQELYEELAGRSEEPVARRRFELLASVKRQHREHLTERYNELVGELPLKLPPSQLPKEILTSKERSCWSVEEILEVATDAERQAREFYLRAAREDDDLSGRAMFRFLADMAYRHWLVLAQERDLIIRYPNYGRRGRTPWHAEKGAAVE
jgi:rubrerythrin